MERKQNTYKILFAVIIIVLVLPAIQGEFKVFKPNNLKGYFVSTQKDTLSLGEWLAGNYQNNLTEVTKDNIGFRPFLIRLHNQIQYSLFGKVSAAGVVVGKENYLYEMNYIKAYNGTDFLGKDSIKIKVDKLAVIRDSLKKHGIDIIVGLAAGKGSFYPEYFPEEYQNQKAKITNQQYFKKLAMENNIPCIDFNSWFVNAKDTSRYMLYPKYGIHWSYYGMVKVADSLIRYVEDLRNTNLINLEITDIEITGDIKKGDYDIGHSLNLLYQLPSPKMAYPKFRWSPDSTATKPKVLVIGDSFYWGLYNMGLPTNSFDTGGFWYYFRQAYPENKPVKQMNIKEKILEQDIIILLGTEATFDRYPYGFIENTYNALMSP